MERDDRSRRIVIVDEIKERAGRSPVDTLFIEYHDLRARLSEVRVEATVALERQKDLEAAEWGVLQVLHARSYELACPKCPSAAGERCRNLNKRKEIAYNNNPHQERVVELARANGSEATLSAGAVQRAIPGITDAIEAR